MHLLKYFNLKLYCNLLFCMLFFFKKSFNFDFNTWLNIILPVLPVYNSLFTCKHCCWFQTKNLGIVGICIGCCTSHYCALIVSIYCLTYLPLLVIFISCDIKMIYVCQNFWYVIDFKSFRNCFYKLHYLKKKKKSIDSCY